MTIKELRNAAAYNCSCTLCSSRYCDDDIHKAQLFKKEVPLLCDAFEMLKATVEILTKQRDANNKTANEYVVKYAKLLKETGRTESK